MISMIIIFFYGFVGLVFLYFIILYAVSNGIDNSQKVKVMRSELKDIKKQLESIEKNFLSKGDFKDARYDNDRHSQ